MTDAKYPAEIAGAINAIMGEVDYVQKKGTNTFHNYKFAAVGDVLAKLQPAMFKHGLVIVQNEVSHTLTGAVMEVKYEFSLIHKSGAVWPDRPVHTGMAAATNSKGGFDDKCVNKCMTAARKYFLLALFQIPTGDDVDADADEGPTSQPANNGHARTAAPKPQESPEQVKAREDYSRIMEALNLSKTAVEIDNIIKVQGKTLAEIKAVSQTGYEKLMAHAEERKRSLTQKEAA